MILDLVIKLLLYFCAISGAIMFLPGNILLDINPKAFHHSLPKSLDKYIPIESVNVSNFEQFGPLFGPESIAHYKGKLVTGSSDGYIYEIASDDTYKPIVKIIDSECTLATKQAVAGLGLGQNCGRPLGLKFDSKGVLFVVEPSFGIYKVENVFGAKPKVSQVFNIEQTGELGKASRFLDDLAVEEKQNGGHVLYISDVSTQFTLEEFLLTLFGSDKGRVIRYDTESKKLDVIATDIFFPNGVELAANNEAVLFTAFASRNVWRYNLKGAKKGTLEKIMSHLPGEPDNIRISSNGKTFWLSTLTPRTLLKPTEFDYYIKKPLLRKLLGRVAHLAGGALAPVARLLNNERLAELAYSLRTLQIALPVMINPEGGMLLEIDLDGNVLNSIYSENEDLGLISEVREVPSNQADQRVLYLGSFKLPYFRKIVIAK